MADWSDIEHAAGDTDYIAHLNTLVSRAEAVATEVETARGGEAALDDRLAPLVDGAVGLTENLPANAHRIVNLADPVGDQDAATKAWTNALLVGGGSPGDIPVTALGPGAATASQLLRIDSGGTAPEGVSPANLAVTGFGKGALSALQLLRANSGGTALEGVSPASLAVTGFGVSGLSALQLLRVNSGGTALEGYVLDVPGFAQKSKSSTYTAVAADAGMLLRLTGTWTLVFQAAATLTDGWWAYLSNEGGGDITLDPSGSETIDGRTSFVMYPGEARLVFCTGAALFSLVLAPFYREFSSSGTFTKPPGYRQFSGLLWGGGGGGGHSGSGKTAGGGGGGACVAFALRAADVGATETVTIGAGGTGYGSVGNGAVGGDSAFGSLVAAYGGGGGGGSTSTNQITAGGGGVLGAGSATAGGGPSGATVATDQKGFGGAIGGGLAGEGVSIYGGGWQTLFGGASGGLGSSTPSYRIGGTSGVGGAGGDGAYSAGASASAGHAPGGGGGGLTYSTYASGSSGAGAAGALRIWGVA